MAKERREREVERQNELQDEVRRQFLPADPTVPARGFSGKLKAAIPRMLGIFRV